VAINEEPHAFLLVCRAYLVFDGAKGALNKSCRGI
jgi:hypothetical protein